MRVTEQNRRQSQEIQSRYFNEHPRFANPGSFVTLNSARQLGEPKAQTMRQRQGIIGDVTMLNNDLYS